MAISEQTERSEQLIKEYDVTCSSCGWKGSLEVDYGRMLGIKDSGANAHSSLIYSYANVTGAEVISTHDRESLNCNEPSISITVK